MNETLTVSDHDPRPMRGDTFSPVELPVGDWTGLTYDAFVREIRACMSALKDERLTFYRNRHGSRAKWTNTVRVVMVAAGAGGILCTALASVVRFTQIGEADAKADVVFLTIALVCYAVMAALSLIDRGLEASGTYFRAIASIMAIRDLWTAYEFDDLAASVDKPADADAELVARKQRIERARTLCAAIDAISLSEVTEWKGAYQTALQTLADTANTGVTKMSDTLDTALTTLKEQAGRHEQARKDALEAAKPAAINIAVDAGESKGAIRIWIDGQLRTQGNQRSFAVTGLQRGLHVLKAELAGDEGPTTLEKVIDVHQAIKDVPISLKLGGSPGAG